MTRYNINPDDLEQFEYHGNTAIERIRLQDGRTNREWIYFDSIEEAVNFFNEVCA